MIRLDSRKPEVSEYRVQRWQSSWKVEGNLRRKETREKETHLKPDNFHRHRGDSQCASVKKQQWTAKKQGIDHHQYVFDHNDIKMDIN